MIIETLSTFPHMYDSVMGASMMQRARDKKIIDFRAYDLREWTYDRHRTTDDDPYGGGPGLVMKCEPIFEAVEDISAGRARRPECAPDASSGAFLAKVPGSCGSSCESALPCEGIEPCESLAPCDGVSGDHVSPCENFLKPCVVFLAPEGERFCDEVALELAREERLLFVCGHYEGIDERAYTLADRVISLGDYVLTSGELASMVVIDAVVRKLPGVLGAAEAGVQDESFAAGLLEYPQYTRPASFRGMDVPSVLLSGDHGAVAKWRRRASLEKTARLRPDLLEGVELSPVDLDFLKSLPELCGARTH